MFRRVFLTTSFSPMLYVVGVLFVSVIAVTAETLVTDTIPIASYFVSSWVAFAGNVLAILAVGLPVFGLLSVILYRIEGVLRPTIWSHIGHCWSLYMLALFLATTYSLLILFDYVLFLSFDAERDLTLFMVAAYAILLDTLITYALRSGNLRWA